MNRKAHAVDSRRWRFSLRARNVRASGTKQCWQGTFPHFSNHLHVRFLSFSHWLVSRNNQASFFGTLIRPGDLKTFVVIGRWNLGYLIHPGHDDDIYHFGSATYHSILAVIVVNPRESQTVLNGAYEVEFCQRVFYSEKNILKNEEKWERVWHI